MMHLTVIAVLDLVHILASVTIDSTVTVAYRRELTLI